MSRTKQIRIVSLTVLSLCLLLLIGLSIETGNKLQASAVEYYGDYTTAGIGSAFVDGNEAYRIYKEESGIFYVRLVDNGMLECEICGVQQEHRGDTSLTIPATVQVSTKNADNNYTVKTFDVIGIITGTLNSHYEYSFSQSFVSQYGIWGFSGMSNLTTLNFVDNSKFKYIKEINTYSDVYSYSAPFLAGTQVRDLTLPSSITQLGTRNTDSSNMSSISYDASLSLFQGSIIEHFTFEPTSPCVVRGQIFRNVINLKSIHLNNNISIESEYAFCNTDLSEGVTISGSAGYTGMLSIPGNTFRDSNLSSVTFDGDCSALTSIGTYAFYNTKITSSIDMTNTGITTIGQHAFDNAIIAQVPVVLPSTLRTIDMYSFYNCKINSVNLDEINIKSIGSYAFKNCTYLTSLHISDTFETMGTEAFANCTALQTVVIDNFKDLSSNYVFSGCSNLVEVTIKTTRPEDQVSALGRLFVTYTWCYEGIKNLKVLNLYGVHEIGYNCASYCTALEEVNHDGSLKIIGDSAFYQCTSLCRIDLSNCETIGERAFSYTLLSSIDLQSCMSLGTGGFASCTSLVDVNLSLLETIPSFAFNDCTSLVNVYAPKCKTVGYLSFYQTKLDHVDETNFPLLEVCENYNESCGAFAKCLELQSVSLPNLTVVGAGTFSQDSKLNYVYLPSITMIGSKAFSECTSLEAITIPNSVTTINTGVFSKCASLFSITFESGSQVTIIPDNFAYNDSSLMYLVLPQSVEQIGYKAFENCSKLQNFILPNTLVSIADYAFSGCDSLTSLILPASVQAISDRAFYSCNNLQTFSISNMSELKTIGASAFQDCSALDNIVIPRNVTRVGYNAFADCSNLRSCDIKTGQLETIESNTFGNTTSLESIFIPDSVKSIADNAFVNSGIKSVNLEDLHSLVTIGSKAFSTCVNLERVEIPENVSSIGTYAFDDLTSLKELKFSAGSVIKSLPVSFVSDNNSYAAVISLPDSLTSLASKSLGSAGTYNFADSTVLTSIGAEIFYEGANNVYNFPATQLEIYRLISYDTATGVYNFNTYSREVKNFTFSSNSTVETIWNSFVRIGESIEFPDSLKYWYQNTQFGTAGDMVTNVNNRSDVVIDGDFLNTYFNGVSLDLKNIEYVGYKSAISADSNVIDRYSGFLYKAPNLNHDEFYAPKLRFFSGLCEVGTSPINFKEKCPNLEYLNSCYSVNSEPDLTQWIPDLLRLVGAGNSAMLSSDAIVTLPDVSHYSFAYWYADNTTWQMATIKLGANTSTVDCMHYYTVCPLGNMKLIVPDENTKFNYNSVIVQQGSNGFIDRSGAFETRHTRWKDVVTMGSSSYIYSVKFYMSTSAMSSGKLGISPVFSSFIHIYFESDAAYDSYYNEEFNTVDGMTINSGTADYNTALSTFYKAHMLYPHKMNTIMTAETETNTEGFNIKARILNEYGSVNGALKVYNVSGDTEEFLKEVKVTSGTTLIRMLDSDTSAGATTYKLYFESETPTINNTSTTVTYDKSALKTVITVDSSQNEDEHTVAITATVELEDTESVKAPKGTLSLYWVDPEDNKEVYIKSASENSLTLDYTMNEDSSYLRSGTNNYVVRFASSDTSTYQNSFMPLSLTYIGKDAGLDGSIVPTNGGMTVNVVIDTNALDYGELSIFLGDNNYAEKINGDNGVTAYIEPKKLQKGTNTVTLVYETNNAHYYSDRKEIIFDYNPVDTDLGLSLLFNVEGDKLNIDAHVNNTCDADFKGTLRIYQGAVDTGVLIKSGVDSTTITTQIDRSVLDFGENTFSAEWEPTNLDTSYAKVSNVVIVEGREVTLIGGVNNLGSNVSVIAKAVCDTIELNPSDIKMYLGTSEFGTPLDVGVTADGKAMAVVDKHMLNVGANNFYVVYVPSSNEFARQDLALQWSMAADGSEQIDTDPGLKPEDLEKVVEAIVDLHNAFDIDIEKLIATLTENFELLDGDLKALKEQLLALTNAQKDYTDKYDSIIDAINSLATSLSGGSSSDAVNDTLKDLLEKFESKLEKDDAYHEEMVNALKQLEKIENLNNNLENIESAIKDGTMSEKEINNTLKDMQEVIESNFDTDAIEKSLSEIVDVIRNSDNSSLDIQDTLEDINNSLNNTNNAVRDVSDTIKDSSNDVVNAINNIGNNTSWNSSGIEDVLKQIAESNGKDNGTVVNVPEQSAPSVTVDTSGIENALNNLLNQPDKSDGTQEVVDAINSLRDSIVNSSTTDNDESKLDTSKVEDLLSQLIEAEKSGSNPVSIDMTGIENALRDLIQATQGNDSAKNDLSDVKDLITQLSDAVSKNQKDVNDLCQAIYGLIGAMGNNNATNSNPTSGINNSELMSSLNRIAGAVSSGSTNSSNNAIDKTTAEGILKALQDLNKGMMENKISKDDLKDLIDAINNMNINFEMPDLTERDAKLVQDFKDTVDETIDGSLKDMLRDVMAEQAAENKKNLMTVALIIGALVSAGILGGSFVLKGAVNNAVGKITQNAEDMQDGYIQGINQQNNYRNKNQR